MLSTPINCHVTCMSRLCRYLEEQLDFVHAEYAHQLSRYLYEQIVTLPVRADCVVTWKSSWALSMLSTPINCHVTCTSRLRCYLEEQLDFVHAEYAHQLSRYLEEQLDFVHAEYAHQLSRYLDEQTASLPGRAAGLCPC